MKLCNCEIKNYPMSLANSAFAHLHNCTILHFRFPNYDPAPHQATPVALASRGGRIIPKSPPKRARHPSRSRRLPRSSTYRVCIWTGRGQARHTTTRPFLSWTAKRKPMEWRNCSCFVKTKFVSGGGAKPAGLKRSLGIGQDAVLGPRTRRRFKSRNARLPRRRFRGTRRQAQYRGRVGRRPIAPIYRT